MKTIVNCWTQKPSCPGLGDLFKGTISLYQYCKKKNYKYVVDIHKHPTSIFFRNHNTEYKDKIDAIQTDIPFFQHGQVFHFIENNPNDLIFLSTNADYTELSDDDREFILNILEPIDEIQNCVNRIISSLPTNYSIMHFRMGDENLINNNNTNRDYRYYGKIALLNSEPTDIIMSDAYDFKKYVTRKYGIPHLNLIPYHFGIETDIKIKDIIVEFFVITKCNKIKHHNIYGSDISGFVRVIGECCNIPITIMNTNLPNEIQHPKLLPYEDCIIERGPIYPSVIELFELHPQLKTDKNTTIYLVNGCSGFGSQLTLFSQNGLYVQDINPDIVCLPYFGWNNNSFKYHEESYDNSFFLYFKYLKEVDEKNNMYFVKNAQISQENFIKYSTPMDKHPINKLYIDYIKDRFELKIGKELCDAIEQRRIPNRKLIGIHIRSLAQKIIHKNDHGAEIKTILDQLMEIKERIDSNCGSGNYDIFIATDVEPYIGIAASVFGNDIIFLNFITRINTEDDSIPLLHDMRGFKLGSDILFDCLVLSLCDEIFVSYSNIPFVIDILKKKNIVINGYFADGTQIA